MASKSINPFEITNVFICGAGQMGTWISQKISTQGFNTIIYDTNEKTLKTIQEKKIKNLSIENSISKASNADLIIETITEDATQKKQLFNTLFDISTEKTILTSNTSALDPNKFIQNENIKRRFACFHFYTPNTIVDIMPFPNTNPDIVQALVLFANHIKEIPIVLNKIIPGYLVGAMASATTDVALSLLETGTVTPETIDKAWCSVTGMKIGPLAILDQVGLDTSLKIRKIRLEKSPNDERLKTAIKVLENYVLQGKLGLKSKIGIYNYLRNDS